MADVAAQLLEANAKRAIAKGFAFADVVFVNELSTPLGLVADVDLTLATIVVFSNSNVDILLCMSSNLKFSLANTDVPPTSATPDVPDTDGVVRSACCYSEIIITDTEDNNLIKDSTDFYSLSALRDLLFHVQEHTFSIPQILQIINKLDLKFCGFENKYVLNLFKKIYKNKEDVYNLNLWNKFESNNQRIFAGMYQFWCQKK